MTLRSLLVKSLVTAVLLKSATTVNANEPCTLCYDRSAPLYPDRIIGQNPPDLTCAMLDAMAQAEATINSTSEQCTNFFHPWGFLACGCVQPPLPANPSCTYCPDGSAPSGFYEDFVIIPAWSTTCTEFDIFVKFTTDPDSCANVQKDSHLTCGCPKAPTTSPAPTSSEEPTASPTKSTVACDLCSDGTYPVTQNVNVVTSFGNYTCQDLADEGPKGDLVPINSCAPLQAAAYGPCGCGNTGNESPSPSPTAAGPCVFCADGTAPQNPTQVVTINNVDYTCDHVAKNVDDLIPAAFCTQLQNALGSACGCSSSPDTDPSPTAAPNGSPSPASPECPICPDGSVPPKLSQVITLTPQGGAQIDFTCEQLHKGEADAYIPTSSCDFFQKGVSPVCGCPATSPTPPPSPSPTGPAVEYSFPSTTPSASPSAGPSEFMTVPVVQDELENVLEQELQTTIVDIKEEEEMTNGGGFDFVENNGSSSSAFITKSSTMVGIIFVTMLQYYCCMN